MPAKMGRPTDNPKPFHMAVRVDDECKRILEEYTRQEKVSRMEAIRRGIKLLASQIKK